MTEPVGLQGRVTRLEQEMKEVRLLASNTDREVAEISIRLSSQIGVINALRETQIEHGVLLKSHDERLDRLEDKVDRGFAKLAAGQELITELLTRRLESHGGAI